MKFVYVQANFSLAIADEVSNLLVQAPKDDKSCEKAVSECLNAIRFPSLF